MYQEFVAAGAEIVGLSSDPVSELQPLQERLNLPFNLYADPECVTIHSLGIFHEDEPKGRSIARPTIYILDASRAIQYRYVGENTRDRPPMTDVLESLPNP